MLFDPVWNIFTLHLYRTYRFNTPNALLYREQKAENTNFAQLSSQNKFLQLFDIYESTNPSLQKFKLKWGNLEHFHN